MVGTEDLLARPQEIYAEVLGFLGLPEWQLDAFPEHNKKPYSAIEPDVRARLEERYADPTSAWSASSAAVGRPCALSAPRREKRRGRNSGGIRGRLAWRDNVRRVTGRALPLPSFRVSPPNRRERPRS